MVLQHPHKFSLILVRPLFLFLYPLLDFISSVSHIRSLFRHRFLYSHFYHLIFIPILIPIFIHILSSLLLNISFNPHKIYSLSLSPPQSPYFLTSYYLAATISLILTLPMPILDSRTLISSPKLTIIIITSHTCYMHNV